MIRIDLIRLNIENTPNTKLPATFTARIFSDNVATTTGDDTIL